MAWCHQAPSLYLNQCWPWSMSPNSAAAKRSPCHQMRPIKQSGDPLPNPGPTGTPRISFAKVHVPGDAAMLDVWFWKYAFFFFNIFMLDHPKFVSTTQRTKWVVRWETQHFLLVAALPYGLSRLQSVNMSPLLASAQLLYNDVCNHFCRAFVVMETFGSRWRH